MISIIKTVKSFLGGSIDNLTSFFLSLADKLLKLPVSDAKALKYQSAIRLARKAVTALSTILDDLDHALSCDSDGGSDIVLSEGRAIQQRIISATRELKSSINKFKEIEDEDV